MLWWGAMQMTLFKLLLRMRCIACFIWWSKGQCHYAGNNKMLPTHGERLEGKSTEGQLIWQDRHETGISELHVLVEHLWTLCRALTFARALP